MGWFCASRGGCARVGLSFFFFSSRRRHTRCSRDWSSDVCSSDLLPLPLPIPLFHSLYPFPLAIPGKPVLSPPTQVRCLLLSKKSSQLEASKTSEIGRASCRERV